MDRVKEVGRTIGLRDGVLLLALMVISFGALFVLGAGVGAGSTSTGGSGTDAASAIALADGVFAGVFLSMGSFLAYLNWRLAPDPRTGWVVAASVLISCQALALSLVEAYDHTHGTPSTTWPLHVVAATALIAVTLAGLGLHHRGGRTVDPLGLGFGLGLVAAAALSPQVGTAVPGQVPPSFLVAVIVAGHLTGAFLVVHNSALARPASALLVATILAIGAGHVVGPLGLDGTIWEVMVSLVLAVTGAAWLMGAYVSLRTSAEQDQRRAAQLEDSLLAVVGSDRENRERLHELRSTIAGLVNATGMLEHQEVHTVARQRLLGTMQRELTRMQRLLAEDKGVATDIHLDDALGVILDLQRLKGRTVELHSSGDVVQARYDALAEVLNILLDNAATHGGSDTSVVEVSRPDDATVEIAVTDFGRGIADQDRQRIFAWGERGENSPGQGIGLHVAQRLMAEDGGSLRCAEPTGRGTSFVISLPAARRSWENDHVVAGRH